MENYLKLQDSQTLKSTLRHGACNPSQKQTDLRVAGGQIAGWLQKTIIL